MAARRRAVHVMRHDASPSVPEPEPEVASRRIEAAEMKLRATLDGVFDAVVSVDGRGRVTGWNSAAERMFGLPAADALGRDARAATGCAVGRPGAGAVRVVEARRAGGGAFPAELAVTATAVAGEPLLVCVFRDVSERLAFERRIQESVATLAEEKGRLEAILAATSDGMVLLDRDGRVVFANRGFGETLGFTPAALAGLAADDLLVRLEARGPVPADAFARALGAPGAARALEPIRCRVERPARRALLLAARPVTTEDGAAQGRLVTFRDVTAEEQARRAKDDLIGNVSHELRTPLTSIRGFVDLLRAGRVGPLAARQREFLDIVAESVARLGALVSDLLDVDRVETAPLAEEPVALGALLRAVAAAEQPAVARKGLALAVDAPADLRVLGDEARLRQVFGNLVSNAVKYTRAGGVTVRARAVAGDRAVIEVEDTGVGIAPEDRARLFERFFRASDAYVREAGGTGLGLSIVKTLVERHGGRVEVESEPGRGSTFRVTLRRPRAAPLRDPGPRAGRGPRQAATERIDARFDLSPEVPSARPAVLVVCDDEEAVRDCRAALDAVAETGVAGAPEEALEAAARRRPDLILLDAGLGGAGGFDLLAEIRRRPGLARVPVLMIGSGDSSARALRVGAEGLLLKPLDGGAVRAEVLRALARGSALGEAGRIA